MVGVIGCLWRVSPTPLGQACWRCLVAPVLFRLGVPVAISALGGDVLHPSRACSFGGQVHVQNFGGWQAVSLVFKPSSLPPDIFGNFRHEFLHPLPAFQKY